MMCLWVIGVPFSWCAFATWKGHVKGHHSTRYGVVLLGLVLCRECEVASLCKMRATWVWWVRSKLLCVCEFGMGSCIVLFVWFALGRLLGRLLKCT